MPSGIFIPHFGGCQDEVGPTEEDASESSRRRLEELESAEQADLTERLKAAEGRNKALKLQNIGVQQGLRQVGPCAARCAFAIACASPVHPLYSQSAMAWIRLTSSDLI